MSSILCAWTSPPLTGGDYSILDVVKWKTCITNLIFDRHVISILTPCYVLHVHVFCMVSSIHWILAVLERHKFIARNQGHFEPANNYQRYIILHSGTIEYQENSIWRRSRLDLQRRVFRTMTYTIWTPQIFYSMKRKRKEDL